VRAARPFFRVTSMFWNRAKASEPKPSSPEVALPPQTGPLSGDRPIDADKVLDALGSVLRTMGKFAFDTDESLAIAVAHRFERWAQHVTIGGRHPDDEPGSAARQGRDVVGMVRDFSEHRKLEQRFVHESVGELRVLVWSFVRSVHRSMAHENADGERTKQQMSRLHAAALGVSMDDLKREALTAVTTLDAILEDRAKRQTTQMAELGERLRTLGRQLEEARRDSELDALTKVGNRRAFDERIERLTELASLAGGDATLVFVDIDNFKSVNDKHGHPVGDVVLSRIADAISRSFLRKSDFVARYGGEEFGVLLQDMTVDAARKLSARLLDRVRELSLDDVAPGLKVTVSVGMAELVHGESHADWLKRADRALYQAKSDGRDRAVEAEPEATAAE
jgi:diguanylate cyclase